MAFPTVAATNTGASDSGATVTHTVNLPASISSGDLLVICVAFQSNPGTISASGWTFLSTGGSSKFLAIGYKTASGSEGASVSVSTVNSIRGAFTSYRITGWSGTPEQGTASTGASGNGDPPNLSPSWGTADTLWIAVEAINTTSVPTVAPTNYSSLITNATGAAGSTAIGSAVRQLNASSDDPGTFTNTSAAWTAQTIAIKPVVAASLAAGAGSYVLTGTAASLKVGRVVAAAAGSFALTGAVATLRRAYVLTAGAGSYSLSGSVATLRRALPLTAGAGSYALTGSAAALKHGFAIPAGVGAYALTGTAASFPRTYVLPAGASGYVLTGTASTLRRALPLTAGAGAYALTGTAAALKHGYAAAAGAGSYALNGTSALFARTYVLGAGAGSYSITGSAATLSRGITLAAGAGTYTFSGAAATLRRTLIISAGAAAYRITGKESALIHGGVPSNDNRDYIIRARRRGRR